MEILEIYENKKDYVDLLLLADEQESMVDKYLNKGRMFIAVIDNEVVAECVVTCEERGIFEIKNLAVLPNKQKKGYGKSMIDYVFNYYKDLKTMYVGTGDSDLTLPFYKKCGFEESHRVKNFFTDNYDHPIFEAGKQLIDMVYLKKDKQKK